MNEVEFKSQVVKHVNCFAVESAPGGTDGIADLFVADGPRNRFVPLELKLYSSIRLKRNKAKPSPQGLINFGATDLTRSQPRWHRNINSVQTSFFLFGDQDELDEPIIIPWPVMILKGRTPMLHVNRSAHYITLDRLQEHIVAYSTVEQHHNDLDAKQSARMH